jgi:multidrug resistance protein, MATE family
VPPHDTSRSARTELRALLSLAIPVVIEHLGIMSMGLVDTVLVGRLGAAELASVGSGSAVYFAYMTLAFGILSAVATTVAHAAGARDDDEVSATLAQGAVIAVGLAAVGLIYIGNTELIFTLLGQPAEMIPLAERYLGALKWGVLATLLNATLRSFLVGLGQARIPMLVSIAGSLLNVGLASTLIFGGLGVPTLGVAGAGYATATVHWLMFAATLTYVLRGERFAAYRARFSLRVDAKRTAQLVRLGVPIGVGSSLESAVFVVTTLVMGRIGTSAVAAHQVAINVAATTFMIPFGISVATTTRVGHAAGSGDVAGAARAGWTGIGAGMGVMVITAISFLLFREQIVGLYTRDLEVAARAAILLLIAGAFQLGDGLQVTSQGALRGLKDTARPMLVNLLAYWFVGFPVGLLLAFELGYEAPGLWWGLTLGLTVAGILHVLRFRKLTRAAGGH